MGTPSPAGAQNFQADARDYAALGYRELYVRARPADSRGLGWLASAVDAAGQRRGRRDSFQCLGRGKFARDFGEVFHVRARDHGLSKESGLQNIVAALIGERASHEDYARSFKESREFADGIQKQHKGQSAGAVLRPGQTAPPDEWNLGRFKFLGDDIEPLRLAWSEDQQKRTYASRRVAERPRSLRVSSSTSPASDGGMVLAATQICSGASRSRNSAISGVMPPAGGRKSYFRFPATFTFTAGAPAAT